MIRRRVASGYTIVELMMAISVMAIGVTGIISMQKITLTANQHAKNLAVATQIASAWIDALAADAMHWNHPAKPGEASDLDQTIWLKGVPAAGSSTDNWFRPAYSPAMAFGPGFDPLGRPVTVANMASAVYCTHLRLNWLFPEQTTVAGNGLIRAEVRVFWLREGGPGSTAAVCAAGTDPDDIAEAVDTYHFVYETGAIRQNRL
jgi:type II secretory pathway pseudopilin PulG